MQVVGYISLENKTTKHFYVTHLIILSPSY